MRIDDGQGPANTQLVVRLPKGMMDAIEAAARATKSDRSKLARRFLSEGLERLQSRKKK